MSVGRPLPDAIGLQARVSGADELRDGFHVLVLDPAVDIQVRAVSRASCQCPVLAHGLLATQAVSALC